MESGFFEVPDPQQEHQCISHQHGDWIIFTCPKCPGYQRQINLITGQNKTTGGRPGINHYGSHATLQADTKIFNPN